MYAATMPRWAAPQAPEVPARLRELSPTRKRHAFRLPPSRSPAPPPRRQAPDARGADLCLLVVVYVAIRYY